MFPCDQSFQVVYMLPTPRLEQSVFPNRTSDISVSTGQTRVVNKTMKS